MAEVKIEITAQDNTSGVFKNIQASSSSALNTMAAETRNYTEGSKSLVTSLKEHWIAASVAVYGAWRMVNEAMDLAKLGAKAQQSEESFRTVTRAYGEDASSLLEKMKQVSSGMIDDSALMQRAVKGLQQGLAGEQITSILEIARTSARTAGKDVVEAFDQITDATANQMTRGLKAMGIVVDQNKAFEDQAKALGTVTAGLTEQQQSQALANAVIAEGTRQMKAMGDVTENASEKFQKMNATITGFKENVGKELLIGIEKVKNIPSLLGKGALLALEGLGNPTVAMWANIEKASGDAAKKISDAEKAYIKMMLSIQQKVDTFNLLKEKIKEVTLSVQEFDYKMQDLDPNANETTKRIAEITSQVQKMKEEIRKSVGENVLSQLAPKIDMGAMEGIRNVYKQQLKDFDDLILSMSNARKEGIIKDLAEIDKTEADAFKKFSNNQTMITAIAKAEDLARIDSLKKWKDSLISMHNEAIAKAREYYKTVDDLNMALSKSAIFMDQWKKGFPTDQTSVFKNEQQSLQLIIDQANNNPIAANLQSAMTAIESFMQKNNQLRNELVDTPGKGLQSIFSDTDAANLYNQYAGFQTALAGVRDAAKSAGDAEMSVAMQLADMIKPVDTAMDLLKSKFTDYVDMISVQRQVTLDTSPAIDSIQAIITKTTEALGYIQQLGRYNTSSTSAMSRLAPSAPAADVAPPDFPVTAVGTPYVRRSGLAWIDQGERVMTADQNKSYSGGSGGKTLSFSFGDIHVHGTNDPGEIARKIMKPLISELREYNHLIGGN